MEITLVEASELGHRRSQDFYLGGIWPTPPTEYLYTRYINVGEMCLIPMNVHNGLFNGVRQLLQWAKWPFACSFNIVYIYQAFILLFHKALHPPALFLSVSVHLDLSLSVVPHPVFLISGLSLRLGDVDVFFLQSSLCSFFFFSILCRAAFNAAYSHTFLTQSFTIK